jgi:hypothetical protein
MFGSEDLDKIISKRDLRKIKKMRAKIDETKASWKATIFSKSSTDKANTTNTMNTANNANTTNDSNQSQEKK